MKKSVLSLFALLFVASMSIYAQDETKVSQSSTTDSTALKVEEMEKSLSKWDKIVKKLPNVSGFVNAQYYYEDSGTNTFALRRARLDFKGDLCKWLEYRLQLEFTSPKIVDAFVKFKISPYFNVQLGQFKLPFSIENPYSPLKLESIDNAQVISKLVGYSDVSGVNAMGRDMGLAFYGGFFHKKGYSIIEYNIGIFNGSGVNTKDNNNNKDFVGRLDIHPIKALTIGGSFYVGQMNDPDADLGVKNRFAASAQYSDGKYLARAEYLFGQTLNQKTNGWYAVIGYWINPKLCPVLRYDTYNSDTSLDNNRSTYYMVGLDYWPCKFLRTQLNYTLKSVESKDKMINLVNLMVSVKF